MAIYGPDGKGVAGGANDETPPGEDRVEVKRLAHWVNEGFDFIAKNPDRRLPDWDASDDVEWFLTRLRLAEAGRDAYKHVVTVRNRNLDQVEERLAQAGQRVAGLEAALLELTQKYEDQCSGGEQCRVHDEALAALTQPQPAPKRERTIECTPLCDLTNRPDGSCALHEPAPIGQPCGVRGCTRPLDHEPEPHSWEYPHAPVQG